jgi:hypothetical protein
MMSSFLPRQTTLRKAYIKRMDIPFEAKIADLYKFCAAGDSIALSENKAGLGRNTTDFDKYKESAHYELIRQQYKQRSPSAYKGGF